MDSMNLHGHSIPTQHTALHQTTKKCTALRSTHRTLTLNRIPDQSNTRRSQIHPVTLLSYRQNPMNL